MVARSKRKEVKISDIFGPPPSLEECPEPRRIEVIPKKPRKPRKR